MRPSANSTAKTWTAVPFKSTKRVPVKTVRKAAVVADTAAVAAVVAAAADTVAAAAEAAAAAVAATVAVAAVAVDTVTVAATAAATKPARRTNSRRASREGRPFCLLFFEVRRLDGAFRFS